MEAGLPVKDRQDAVTIPENRKLSPEQLYQHDPLLVLLKDRIPLNDFVVMGGVVAITAGILFAVGLLSGVPFSTSYIIRGSFQAFVIYPLISLVYRRVPLEIGKLFNTLDANGVIGPYRDDRDGSNTYEHFLIGLVKNADQFLWTIVALLLVVIYCAYRILLHVWGLIGAVPWIFEVTNLINNSFMIYSATIAISRLLVALVYTNLLFHSFWMRLSPLHPDGSAGLGIMGEILGVSAGLMALLGLAGIVLNDAFLSQNPAPYALWEALVVGIFYLVLAPVMLLGWLILPHRVMMEARGSALQPLADQFETTVVTSVPKTTDTAEDIKQGTDRLSELKRRYDLLQDTFPVWPASIQQIRRWTATISLPAIITFVASIPEIYIKLATFIRQIFHI